jgi:hypothetical protein
VGKGRYLGTIPRQLSPEDKHFIKLIEGGSKKAPAFRESYPNHPAVIKWRVSEPGSPDRHRAIELIISAAKNKLQAKYMQSAIVSYQDSMEKFSELSVKAAIDLVENARSEKVRADLAIEGMRQKIGTPVQKIAIKEDRTVTLVFGDPPKEEQEFGQEIIEGEVV